MIRSKTVASFYNLLTFGYAEPLSSFFNVIFPSRSLNSAKVLRNIIGGNLVFCRCIVANSESGVTRIYTIIHQVPRWSRG